MRHSTNKNWLEKDAVAFVWLPESICISMCLISELCIFAKMPTQLSVFSGHAPSHVVVDISISRAFFFRGVKLTGTPKKWVWVKIRHPNNWMVNTKLDIHICGPLGLPFWPTSKLLPEHGFLRQQNQSQDIPSMLFNVLLIIDWSYIYI